MSHEARVTYRHGFFPYYIVDDSRVGSVQGASVRGISLTGLSRCWWLSKTFDWSINLAYTIPAGEYGDTGTFTGSGTINVNQNEEGPTAPSLPGSRFPNPASYSDFVPFTGFTWIGAGATLAGVNAAGPYSYPGTEFAGSPLWFAPMYDSEGVNLNSRVSKISAGNYRTAMDFSIATLGEDNEFYVGLTPDSYTPPPGSPTEFPTSANLRLKVYQETDVVLPFSAFVNTEAFEDVSDDYVPTISGEVVINFNNFWTP